MVQIDTLFQTKTAKKLYPLGPHMTMYPVREHTPGAIFPISFPITLDRLLQTIFKLKAQDSQSSYTRSPELAQLYGM